VRSKNPNDLDSAFKILLRLKVDYPVSQRVATEETQRVYP
jgi:hypothetical protein